MSGILKRVRDITMATLNERLDKVEDPVRLIDQFLMRTRHDINEADRLYQQYVMHANQMRNQMNQAQELCSRREQQAMLALKAGEEFAAKIALQEKLMHEDKVQQYSELYEKSKDAILELEEQLNMLKSEYQAVYDKRQYYIARMQTVRLQQQMNERFGQYGVGQVDSMFRRLEDRVSGMEWETQGIQDVRRMSGQTMGNINPERDMALKREMERLKQKLDSAKE
ncbi:phage-shock protein [Paenibacillus sp. E194]|jgi:phage shock protein A|uniref:Phage shock protein A (IM30), suppresses sigma54-dependent transcription n=4 Tax=Paenibacillus TaxID=44249 RepID=A0A383R4D9_PAEAL|nr:MULTISPECIES: PspA/IM30 family protein [Paenibacillus]EPY08402.1 phage shock protein A (IM30), suppresses sigma54-dependent transcription [Paenibacillus alvei TS-15]EPY12786.1 phage shock protein A (IM30), suppresses sigma54-dependent transcription [Paenibacillus alvei A6-6i-x]KJB85180.1 phage-shock protein [Paenibacillus sp. E194]MCM3291840.1 PspA/IM30 family protein [Paenibacillus sp. MER 180]MCY9533003.1 PspA/IM30 family protein [Paenibacillus alvei]